MQEELKNRKDLETMFKKKNQAEQSFKEKKIGTIKVGTHKKTVIVLWVVLIASMSFGVYKNFTDIDLHTVHETETIQLKLMIPLALKIL